MAKTKETEETVKFIDTTDWHIRDIQYGRRFRGDDFRRAINQVIDLAIRYKVDFIINGGDTLNINRPSETMLDFLFVIHNRLLEAGIPMFTVTGNHDASEPSFLRFPERTSSNPGLGGIICIDYEQQIKIKGVSIAGWPAIPFGPPKVDGVRGTGDGTSLLERLTAAPPVDIAVWHGALEEFVPFPMRDSGSMFELPAGYARAWLVGDIHLRARKRLTDGTLVSYAGPVEMCDRGEPAQKFVDYYELKPGWRAAPFPEPIELQLDTRPVIFLSVADEPQADQALAKIRQAIRENPGRAPMIFARYAREMKPWVNRVQEIIDQKETVFRAASFSSVYRGQVHAGQAGGLPSMASIVDEVLPVGSPLNALAQKLVMPGALSRHEITTWVEEALAQ